MLTELGDLRPQRLADALVLAQAPGDLVLVVLLLFGQILPVLDSRPGGGNDHGANRDPFRHWQGVQLGGMFLRVFAAECCVQFVRPLGMYSPQCRPLRLCLLRPESFIGSFVERFRMRG